MNIIPVGFGGAYPNQVSSVPITARQLPGVERELRGLHDGIPFAELLRGQLAHVNQTAEVARQDSIALALGEIDDIAAMNINSARAGLAFDLLVQMRNRVLEAYQEMMRMNV